MSGAASRAMLGGVFVIGLLGPAIWGGAMRFRLASTRWRGIQMHFRAGWGEIYRASWPASLSLALTGTAALQAWLLPWDTLKPKLAEAVRGGTQADFVGYLLLVVCAVALVGLALVVLGARLDYNYRRLLFQRAALGEEPGRFKPRFVSFLRVTAAAAVGWVAAGVAVAGLSWVAIGPPLAGLATEVGHTPPAPDVLTRIVLVVLSVPLALWALATPAMAWREARLFAIVWNGAGLGRFVRTECRLSAWRFVGLRIANVALTLVTLGLWRPFARVAEYRMKVGSVRLHVRGDLDTLTGRLRAQQGGVADALADAAGLDLVG